MADITRDQLEQPPNDMVRRYKDMGDGTHAPVVSAVIAAGSAEIGSVTAEGDAAHDAADSGNPVKIGGKAETTSPTAVADGDRVDAWFDEYGRLTVKSRDSFVEVTPVLDTSGAYSIGDLLFDATEVPGAVINAAGTALAISVALIDKDDQGTATDLYFWSGSVDMGTLNLAVAVADDANLAKYLGHYSLLSTDWKDLGPGKVAVIKASDLGFLLKADSGTSLYIGAVTQGAPTHTASGLLLRIGLSPA